jgi:hypothetical protein
MLHVLVFIKSQQPVPVKLCPIGTLWLGEVMLGFWGAETVMPVEDVSRKGQTAASPIVAEDAKQGLPDNVTSTSQEDDSQNEPGSEISEFRSPDPGSGPTEVGEGKYAGRFVEVRSGARRDHSIHETVFLRAEAMPENQMKVYSRFLPFKLPTHLDESLSDG